MQNSEESSSPVIWESRKIRKPMMEKKRRARINICISQLKNLVCDGMKQDPYRYSKWEKSEILEMTVRHLITLKNNTQSLEVISDPHIADKFQAGFDECLNRVLEYSSKAGLNSSTKEQLVNYLQKVKYSKFCLQQFEPNYRITNSLLQQGANFTIGSRIAVAPITRSSFMPVSRSYKEACVGNINFINGDLRNNINNNQSNINNNQSNSRSEFWRPW